MNFRHALLSPRSMLLALSLALVSTAFARDHFDARNRDRIVSLRGTWLFSIGDDLHWAQPGFDDHNWSEISVPNYWEDEGYENYNGYAWYRRTFSFNDDPSGTYYLLLGQIDDVDEVFVNGQRVGGMGQFPPNYVTAYNRDRVYALPSGLLKKGERNLIAVRVYDGAMNGGMVGQSIGIYAATVPHLDLDLSGEWKFQPGDNPAWKDERADDSKFATIPVPSYWENAGYDIDGFAWYRKNFRAQVPVGEDRMVLLLGRIDDTDEVFLNGIKIGGMGSLTDADRHNTVPFYRENRGYYFSASLLKEENVVAVRVHDHGGMGGIYEGPIGLIRQSRYAAYWEAVRTDHGPAHSIVRMLLGDSD